MERNFRKEVMPFKSDKQRKYLFAKKPEVAKKLAKKDYEDGGIVTDDEVKKSRMKKGVPGYKARRFMNKLFGGGDSEPEEKEKPKKEKYQMIKGLFNKHRK